MDDPDRWQSLFVQRMRALFEANGQPAPELSLGGEAADAVGFTVDGVDFEISFHAPLHRDHLLLECEFGAAPRDEWALRKLLRLNRRLQPSGRGSFGWRRETDAITFGMLLPLAQCEKDTIEAVMAAIAQQAHHWRAGRSLDEAEFPAVDSPDEQSSPPYADVRSELVRVLHEVCDDERVDGVEELDAPPQVLALRLAVGDAEVTLVHAEPGSVRLTLECEYGAAPIVQPVEILLKLLESTDSHATGGADGFSLEGPADLVVYRSTCLGPDWTSQDLLTEILDIGRSSTEWFEACWRSQNPSQVPSHPVDELVDVLN
ncbi:CesT family type III secretion system chaperone [Rhizobacter sp. OV335]|uniref:CesT family type III secretion system chaperone n=1 Tax=Rhizobacter sp. OV335 TaxID=1500264 RepID=UPI00091E42CF|nr:CesT family type III secretion system chaperone [Rhizobacter sp. OV335]SHN22004.1 Tir chaperone protein (CesT) family protein [Rhizobacter sp. OV335]